MGSQSGDRSIPPYLSGTHRRRGGASAGRFIDGATYLHLASGHDEPHQYALGSDWRVVEAEESLIRGRKEASEFRIALEVPQHETHFSFSGLNCAHMRTHPFPPF